MAIDADDRLWVADACNHRVQVFDTNGRLLKLWGTPGSQPGQLSYPYGLLLDGEGHVYVTEFGNHRVQKFTLGRAIAGLLGTRRPRARRVGQTLGHGARQPGSLPRAGYQ